MVQNLPIEIWLYIAEFIPPRDFVKLVSANRVFFNMIMNELYGDLSFISADPRIFVEKLKTLQTPSLASRVRKLTVWPAAIREAIRVLEPVEPLRPVTPSARRKIKGKQPSKFESVTKLPILQDFLRKSPTSPKKCAPPKPTLPKPETRLEMFLAALRTLDNVEELEINWSIDKGHKDYIWKFPFFNDIWQSVGPTLRRLSIEVKLSKMQDVIRSIGALPNVEELELTLRKEAGDANVEDSVVPDFVNKMKASLCSLTIKTIGHQELTFFTLLEEFPHLKTLALSMPLDSHHLPSVDGFRKFIINHPTIRTLELRYTPCCRESSTDGFHTPGDDKHILYSNLSLPALQNLKLGLRLPIPRSGRSSFLRSIASLNTTLVSLTLVDRSLSLDEVKTVIPYFARHSLRKLSLFAKNLSPQLIDVLAKTCPVLGSLSLDVQNVIKSETVGSSSPPPKDSDVVGFVQALFGYAVDLDNDRWRYKTWSLTDISVMRWAFGVGHGYDYECMKAIAYVVPTVRSFSGKGDMTERGTRPSKPGTTGKLIVDIGEKSKPLDQ
ncbi:hypothetical protein CVT24_011893 [Panaeolus cyanescens]|uniref:F-box domain-containing protein n=1 Tax=Panaeolus cyanescens TaxID=181874 RepID=A0A409YNX3_9AGAR|nr:hypothetical protein CVT24_011893 [Panaeolus cyanescens]